VSALADRIVVLGREGLHIAAIAQRLGCTRGWVGEVLLLNGVAARPRPDRFTGRVLAAHDDGLHIASIARTVGCSHQWVSHILHTHTLDPHPRPEVQQARARRAVIRSALASADLSIRDLAVLTDVPLRRVRKDLHLLGLSARPAGKPKHPKRDAADQRRQRIAGDLRLDPTIPSIVLAQRYGVSLQQIRVDRQRLTGSSGPEAQRRASAHERRSVIQSALASAHLTVRDLAALTNSSPRVVRNDLRRLNLTVRSAQGAMSAPSTNPTP